MNIKMIPFQIHGDERGSLIALEENKNIPFTVKRVYYMFDTKQGVHRGFHAHKTLKQILFCPSGACTILLDSGLEKRRVRLDKPTEGLYLESNIWREMYDFTPDAVLMVLASDYYDESDYIRNYDMFLDYINVKRDLGE
ncbi:MAG: WxcM-like domain-containing protein [Lachnospiraceae bacterium]|nr:WxcM-like domain-containing protein [Lachnospiraceae bacterium]MCI9325208.1 WxcM-like domain-containing protein [Lachnospiraceae bacterium]